MNPTLLAFGMPGPIELMVIAGFGLLIFGRRLPEVGKGLARSIVEFKKGLREVTEEIDVADAPTVKPVAPAATVTTNATTPTGGV